MLLTSKVENTYTIDQFIELGKSIGDIDYNKFSILSDRIDTNNDYSIIVALKNVIYDYEEELKKLSCTVELTIEELQKYRYKPKLLSYDLYGTVELYFIILFLNGTCDIKEFDRRTIKLITKSKLFELLESIYNAETDYINSNRTKINYQQ